MLLAINGVLLFLKQVYTVLYSRSVTGNMQLFRQCIHAWCSMYQWVYSTLQKNYTVTFNFSVLKVITLKWGVIKSNIMLFNKSCGRCVIVTCTLTTPYVTLHFLLHFQDHLLYGIDCSTLQERHFTYTQHVAQWDSNTTHNTRYM